jgi:acetolactate synthase-1/2/3 large subunit
MMAKETMTGAQALWAALVREGVTEVFGYPGGAILPAYDAMLAYPIHHVLVRHEQGANQAQLPGDASRRRRGDGP